MVIKHRLTLHVAVLGHRVLHDNTILRVTCEGRQHFARWLLQYEHVEVFSALAVGADTLLAEVALDLGCTLVVVAPFAGYADEFDSGERQRYQVLLNQARTIVPLPHTERSRAAFAEAGRWLVDQADVILAVWDGMPERSQGGTAETIRYARQAGKPVSIVTIERDA